MTVVARKCAAVDRLNVGYGDIAWRPRSFEELFAAALVIHPHAPRVEVLHLDFPAYERWLADRGWYVHDRGVHPWSNSFSVVARRST